MKGRPALNWEKEFVDDPNTAAVLGFKPVNRRDLLIKLQAKYKFATHIAIILGVSSGVIRKALIQEDLPRVDKRANKKGMTYPNCIRGRLLALPESFTSTHTIKEICGALRMPFNQTYDLYFRKELWNAGRTYKMKQGGRSKPKTLS